MTHAAALGRVWDLSAFFPTFESPERHQFEVDLGRDVESFGAAVARLGPPGGAWEPVLLTYERLLARLSHLATYVVCVASADADDERYALAEGRVAALRASVEKSAAALKAPLREASDAELDELAARPALAGARHFLQRLREEARQSMPPELEGLTAELSAHGIVGWSRLYDNVSAKLCFDMVYPDGKAERVPMAQRRSLMADPDRRVRQAAFTAGNVAWEGVADVLGAALNHIAGTRLLLNQRRGVAHFLDVALHQAGTSRATLDAMLEALRDRAELPRAGLRLKARAMDVPAISWFDLEAPFPSDGAARVPFERGVEMVREAFARGYPRLATYLDGLLERRAIESEARAGKRPGAYCATSELTDEVRIFMTYQGSLGDISTLAHEVGHGFHSEVLRGTRTFARNYPMTLAETASTFAESLLSDGLLSDPDLSRAQRILLLGEVVGDASAFLLDVPTRFAFEKRFHEERQQGEVPVSRLSELMAEAQRATFGDALLRGGEDPLFWASKLHFYISDITFYNFPYTFGFLLSRGMFAMFKREGAAFLPRYERFLQASGSAPAHEVAKTTLGCDLTTPTFWLDAIDTLKAPIAELEGILASAG